MKRGCFYCCPGCYWDGHHHFRRGFNDTPVIKNDRHSFWAAADRCSSTKAVLPENENPSGRRRRPFQSYKAVQPKIENPAGRRRLVLKLYYQRTKIQLAAGDGHLDKAVLLVQWVSEQPLPWSSHVSEIEPWVMINEMLQSGKEEKREPRQGVPRLGSVL